MAGAEAEVVTPRIEASVDSGLAFLARQQQPDGHFAGPHPHAAITALTTMAFLAAGHVPDSGPYGKTVRRAIDFLLAIAPADGYYGAIDGSRMYGQGIITLALAEAYGVEPDIARRARMRQILEQSIAVIISAQGVVKDPNHQGGWRYEPRSADSDLSLSGWNALALRAARNVGIDVPDPAVGAALAYVRRCYSAERKGFSYQPYTQAPTPGLTGVGLLNVYLLSGAGAEDDPAQRAMLNDAAAFLATNPIMPQTRFQHYSTYYVTQAAFQIGGEVWTKVWVAAQERMVSTQQPDGGWPPSRSPEEPGRVYATSMAILTLAVPYRLLPIYQR